MAADNPYPSWGDRRNLHACWICLIAAEPLQAPRLQPTYAYAPRRDWAGPSTVVFYGRSLRSQLPPHICGGSAGSLMGCRKENTLARRRRPLMLYVEQSRFDVFAPGLLSCFFALFSPHFVCFSPGFCSDSQSSIPIKEALLCTRWRAVGGLAVTGNTGFWTELTVASQYNQFPAPPPFLLEFKHVQIENKALQP